MIVPDENLLSRALEQVEVLMSHRRRAVCAQPRHRDISLPQLYLLMMLEEVDSMTVSDLAHLLGISAPSASSFVDRMEENGLVIRQRDLEDRRVVHVRLLPRGHEMAEELMGLKRDTILSVLERFTNDELQSLIVAIQVRGRATAEVREEAVAGR
jgi:MarR family transcriptional regulator, organic hydroperoxide resistance regulator